MTAPINATRAQVLEDAIRQCAQVAEGLRESYSSAESLETLLGAVDVLMERVRTAPRDDAPDIGGAAQIDADDVQFVRAALAFVAHYIEDAGGSQASIEYGPTTFTPARLRAVRSKIGAGVVRNCERRTAPATEIGDEGAAT